MRPTCAASCLPRSKRPALRPCIDLGALLGAPLEPGVWSLYRRKVNTPI